MQIQRGNLGKEESITSNTISFIASHNGEIVACGITAPATAISRIKGRMRNNMHKNVLKVVKRKNQWSTKVEKAEYTKVLPKDGGRGYRFFERTLDAYGLIDMMIVHESAFTVDEKTEYGFIFDESDYGDHELIINRLKAVCPVYIDQSWTSWIINEGRNQKLLYTITVVPVQPKLRVWALKLNEEALDKWQAIVTDGLKKDYITFPEVIHE